MHTIKQNLRWSSLFLATLFIGCSPKFTEEKRKVSTLYIMKMEQPLGTAQVPKYPF